jgi:hypothetical protein
MTKTDDIYKPGYEGERPSTRLTGPERQVFLQAKRGLVRRIHDAMMVLSVEGAAAELGLGTGSPSYLVEFSDKVGQEKEAAPVPRFRPTPAQVSDCGRALELLEGLTRTHIKVVMLRALDEFAREIDNPPGEWPWSKIGAHFGYSDRWAEEAYTAAIVQAARRAGVLPMVSRDHAVVVVSVWVDRGWLTSISTTADPRQELANLRAKSPVRLEQAFTFWMAGSTVTKRVATEAKADMRALHSHGGWYKANPDTVADILVRTAREAGAGWHFEEIDTRRAA